MPSESNLVRHLAEFFESARQDYVESLTARRVPLTEFVPQVKVIDNAEKTGWAAESEVVEHSTVWKNLFHWKKLNDELRHRCLDISADIIASYSDSLPFWNGGFGGYPYSLLSLPNVSVDFNSEPNTWVALNIVVPSLIEYLYSLRSVDTPEIPLAERIAHEAIALASSNHLMMTNYLPVMGIEMGEERLTSGDIVVRKLTPFERGSLLQQVNDPNTFSILDPFLYFPTPAFSLPTHMIELTIKSSRTERPGQNSQHKQALCAFFLHNFNLSGPGRMVSQASIRWVHLGRSGRPIQLRPHPAGKSKPLDQDELGEVEATFKRLRNYDLDQPANSRDLALHRFLLGSTRESSIDSLLDYTVCLESILLPYDPATRHSDLSYRFRLHGAHYIGESQEERDSVWKQLRDIYEIRSRVVHGSHYPSRVEIETHMQSARALSTTALLKAVNSHFPRVEEFNAWARSR